MKEITSPIKAIRAKCLECSNYSSPEVRECTITECALYPFRLGKNPYLKRNLTEEQKQKQLENLAKARNKIKSIGN